MRKTQGRIRGVSGGPKTWWYWKKWNYLRISY